MSISPKRLARNESMLFNLESTYRTDYSNVVVEPRVTRTTYNDYVHQTPPRPEYKPLKDTHAMTDYRNANVPFTLFWNLDPILRKPFKHIEKPSEELENHEREEAQRTRPRVLLTPADAIDNIVDKTARARFCEDMYTSEMVRGLREWTPVFLNVRAPYPGTNAPPQPITLPKWRPAYVSPEWRMESVKQDSEQLRAYGGDPTEEFWLHYPAYYCRACDESKIVTEHRQMEKQKKKRMKRSPFKV